MAGLDFDSSWKFPESPIEDADEFKFSSDEVLLITLLCVFQAKEFTQIASHV